MADGRTRRRVEGDAEAEVVASEGAGVEPPAEEVGQPLAWLERVPILGPLWSAYLGFMRNGGFMLSAGLAYYGLFSIVPIGIVATSIAGLIIGEREAQAEMTDALSGLLGPEVAELVSSMIAYAKDDRATTGTIVGAALLLYGAVRLFLKLQAAFDVMWGIRVVRSKLSLASILDNSLTFAMGLLPALLLLGAFVLEASASWLAGALGLGWLEAIIGVVGPLFVSWVALVAVMAILPNARLSWWDCKWGAMIASGVCIVGARLFGSWVSWSFDGAFTASSAISVVMALIVAVHVLAVAVLVCVSLNRVLFERKGRVLSLEPHARLIGEEGGEDSPPS